MPEFVADHINNTSFEEKCEFYYLLMKNKEYFEDYDY